VQIFTRPFVDGDSVLVQGIGNLAVSGVVEKTTGGAGALQGSVLKVESAHRLHAIHRAQQSKHVASKHGALIARLATALLCHVCLLMGVLPRCSSCPRAVMRTVLRTDDDVIVTIPNKVCSTACLQKHSVALNRSTTVVPAVVNIHFLVVGAVLRWAVPL
jgi:hypothetical protein